MLSRSLSRVVPSAQGADDSNSLVATVRALEEKIAENGGSWLDTVEIRGGPTHLGSPPSCGHGLSPPLG